MGRHTGRVTGVLDVRLELLPRCRGSTTGQPPGHDPPLDGMLLRSTLR